MFETKKETRAFCDRRYSASCLPEGVTTPTKSQIASAGKGSMQEITSKKAGDVSISYPAIRLSSLWTVKESSFLRSTMVPTRTRRSSISLHLSWMSFWQSEEAPSLSSPFPQAFVRLSTVYTQRDKRKGFNISEFGLFFCDKTAI